MVRKVLALTLVLSMGAVACGGDGGAVTTATAATTTTIRTTTTTTSTTTTSTTTTTIPIEELDAALAVALWDGLTEAWEEGHEEAARYEADHAYEGVPAAYEDCLRPAEGPGFRAYVPDVSGFLATPEWDPSIDISEDTRVYEMPVDVRLGMGDDAEWTQKSFHVGVRDGVAYHFVKCVRWVDPDALAYRLTEGDTYRHKVTYRADITEDQSPAGGRRRTGRETWTVYRAFDVTDVGTEKESVTMDIERVVFDFATTVGSWTHGASWDSEVNTEEQEQTGPMGDLVGASERITVYRAGALAKAVYGFSFIDLPVAVVAEGDSWESDWALDGPSMSGDMTVTVVSMDETTVTVSLEGSGSGSKTYLEFPSARYKLVTEGLLTGSAVIDRQSGWVISVEADIEAEGTIEFITQGFWNGIRPLNSSDEITVGVEMPTTYTIHLEVASIGD